MRPSLQNPTKQTDRQTKNKNQLNKPTKKHNGRDRKVDRGKKLDTKGNINCQNGQMHAKCISSCQWVKEAGNGSIC